MSSTRSSSPRAERDRLPGVSARTGARHLWRRMILGAAGLLGAAGVALGAASAHVGGGDFARLAALFLLIHAAALPGVLAVPVGRSSSRNVAASLIAIGVALFSGDLAVLGFTGHTPLAGLAPTGGIMLIVGWLALTGAALMDGWVEQKTE